jgi:hypothetical protein
MFREVEGAKLSLVVEHIEVFVFRVVVDQGGKNLLLAVSVGTEIVVRALADSMGIVRAELFLVFLVVVVFLDEGVREQTGIAIGTLLIEFYEIAHLGVVHVAVPLSVLGVVVVDAVFVVMVFGDVAGGNFEYVQVEMLNVNGGTLTTGAIWNW